MKNMLDKSNVAVVKFLENKHQFIFIKEVMRDKDCSFLFFTNQDETEIYIVKVSYSFGENFVTEIDPKDTNMRHLFEQAMLKALVSSSVANVPVVFSSCDLLILDDDRAAVRFEKNIGFTK